MAFTSIAFLFFFLPIFLAVYFAAPGIGAKNLITLLASLLFYAWGEPGFVPVLAASILVNGIAARGIEALEGTARRVALALTVAADLLLLGVYKYTGFALGTLAALLAPLGLTVPVPTIALPLGISFFTFHCLSYVIDVHRRRFPANRNPVQVALYIALFPQLIAGPIVRYGTVARQLQRRRHTLARAAIGMRIFIIGLAQKVLIADLVAPLADAVFDRTAAPGLADSWLGTLAYTMQIYFDFSGYSNMAVGLGIMLGFTLPRNFRLPYTSLSITGFWRRWHMSLSRWLRDYLYIPLGGSRGRARQTWRNLITVFVLCGLWHGANWTFVLWGAWHGAFLVIERAGLGRNLARLPVLLRWVYAMLVVMGGWVLFRARDFGGAARLYGGLLGLGGTARLGFEAHLALNTLSAGALIVGSVLAVAPRVMPRLPLAPSAALLANTAWALALLLLSALFVAAGTYSPFLYFRF